MNKKTLSSILFFAILLIHLKAQDYRVVWDYVNNNDRSQAMQLLTSKISTNKASTDEFITYVMLMSFDGKESDVKDFGKYAMASENPAAYIYSLWFSDAVVGNYGYKTPKQLDILNTLIKTTPCNGTMRAASYYSLGHYYANTHKFNLVGKANSNIGAISNWQYVGPFNNISGSGFNKNYEPISDTSNSTIFYSTENAPIKWFTPSIQSGEGWIHTSNFISGGKSNINFAQTFVNSPSDQDAYICAGFSGNFKVWVNDQLMIIVPDEKVTEMDAYVSKCHLNAGYNRILVQIGDDEKNSNFIIRLTNSNFDPLLNLTSTAKPHAYKKIGGESTDGNIPQFAETYYQEKIKKDSTNLINHILLNRTYLRNGKVFEARKIIEKALALAPNNSILKYELALCYSKEKNNTGTSEISAYFKEKEKNSYFGYELRVSDLSSQKNYQEAMTLLKEEEEKYGESTSIYDDKIQFLSKLNKVPELLSTINEAYKKYPHEAKFANYAFNVEKLINKNSKKAIKVLERYMEDNYNYDLTKLLTKEYFEQNNSQKAYQLIQDQIDTWPYNASFRKDLLNEYLTQQRYPEAYTLCKIMLSLKPYSGYYYDNLAQIQEATNHTNDAIESYQKALTYQPTLYESREKQRVLQGKKPLQGAAPQDSISDLIARTSKKIDTRDYDYYYLDYDLVNILYPEGAQEEYFTVALKILNQRGVDRYKQTSITFNSNSESLVIQETQLIKPNGKKINPEINENQIVWTGLEVGDVLYMKYKKKYYYSGKFAREFYDHDIFGSSIPIETSRYTLIIPKDRKFNYQVINGAVEPKISDIEDYRMYTWEPNNTLVIKDEEYAPSYCDIAPTLHISTLNEWNDIAQWYSDIVYSKIALSNDFVVNETYNKLFSGKKNLTSHEKAKIIYDFIENNINYSSVSFLQSGLIPQKASTTINTKLGDCKDLSTLFISLAKLCDLKANLVLVSTRDNGSKNMILPSFLFDHCIVKYFDEKNMEHYLELTNRNIPFQSLPYTLFQATCITIPSKDDLQSKFSLSQIDGANKTPERVITHSNIDVTETDLKISYTNTRYGSIGASTRMKYKSLSKENTNKKMIETVSSNFSNQVKVSDVSFTGLDELSDSITANVSIQVSNEVKKIGVVYACKIPYTDVIINAKPFNQENREYDFEYWSYEDVDEYETATTISIPSGKTLVDIPANEKLTFGGIIYTLNYKKISPTKLVVVRKAKISRNTIPSKEYNKLKEFAGKIVAAENSYITFK